MEPQEFLAQLGSSIGDAILTFHHGHLIGSAERRREGFDIQRPGVDMGIDAEYSGRAIQERLGLFPVFTGI